MLLLTKAVFVVMIGFLTSAILGLMLVPILRKLKKICKSIDNT